MKNTYKYPVFVLFTLSMLFVATTTPVFAQAEGGTEGSESGTDSPFANSLDRAVEPVTTLVRDIAMSIVKFLTFAGGVIFVMTVVLGAAKGSLGSAIGNRMQVSEGLMALIMGGGALLLMLMAVPLANNLLEMLVERLLTPETLDIPNILEMAGAEAVTGATRPDELLQIPVLQDTIVEIAITVIRVAISLGTTAFIVAVVTGALDTQLGTMMGGGMMAGRGLSKIITSVAAVVILLISFPLSRLILETLVPRVLPSITISSPF